MSGFVRRIVHAVLPLRGRIAIVSLIQQRWKLLVPIMPRRMVVSRGIRFSLQCTNAMTYYRWKTYNEKEPETLDWIDQHINDREVLFDIGANTGVYSLYAALRHPHLRVVAIEPEYANLHLLRDNVAKNRLHAQVLTYGLALSNMTGLSQLHIQDLTPGAALHSEHSGRLEVTCMNRPVKLREGICVFTLDAFCHELRLSPNHLKIDVDGTEQKILEGAQATLRSKSLRSVLIEVDENNRDLCHHFLREAGLVRHWRDQTSRSLNEVWIRE